MLEQKGEIASAGYKVALIEEYASVELGPACESYRTEPRLIKLQLGKRGDVFENCTGKSGQAPELREIEMRLLAEACSRKPCVTLKFSPLKKRSVDKMGTPKSGRICELAI